MKHITTAQLEEILKVVYLTNIPVSQFDALRKMLTELPDCPQEEEKEITK